MKRIQLITFVAITFISCKKTTQQSQVESNPLQNTDTSQIEIYQTKVESLVGGDKDTIIYDLVESPIGNYETQVLTTGVFHEVEVSQSAGNLEWYGIFLNGHRNYLAKTRIELKRVYDPILDDDNEKTGWEILTENKDTCALLIESLPILTEREIHEIELPNTIFPGDTTTFNYLGLQYTLFATGEKRKVQDDSEWFEVWNYKLFLMVDIKGVSKKSLLIAHPNFDDAMTTILFAGDIDGDGILDLIIDSSRHYNATYPTLYLSKPANQEEVVKPIGGMRSVGC